MKINIIWNWLSSMVILEKTEKHQENEVNDEDFN
jgi:hypothetical protein